MSTELPSTHPGRVAVVTGAARGIGRAAAVVLASAGVDIVGIDIAGHVKPHPRLRTRQP